LRKRKIRDVRAGNQKNEENRDERGYQGGPHTSSHVILKRAQNKTVIERRPPWTRKFLNRRAGNQRQVVTGLQWFDMAS
jgi:hypothetical protein